MSLVALLLAVGVYFILAAMSKGKLTFLNPVKKILEKKLFFEGFLRYMITSYLKMQISLWTFFIFSYSLGFEKIADALSTIGAFVGIIFFLAYPVFIMFFLFKNQDTLDTEQMKKKFSTAYEGINTESKYALLYGTVFSVRRFLFVMINISFDAECPWTNFGQSVYLFKIIFFIVVQSVYLMYIVTARPHDKDLFNLLEYVNEGCLIVLAYIMIAFSGVVGGQTAGNELAELLAFGMTILIVVGNYFVIFN